MGETNTKSKRKGASVSSEEHFVSSEQRKSCFPVKELTAKIKV